MPSANSADDTVHSLTPRLPGVIASALAMTANGSAAAICQRGKSAPIACALTAPISTSSANRSTEIASRRRPIAGASSGDRARAVHSAQRRPLPSDPSRRAAPTASCAIAP